MSAARIVNLLKSHLHIASINRAVAPGGSVVVEKDKVEKDAEIAMCVRAGYISVVDDDGKPIVAPPAVPVPPVAPEHKVDMGSTMRTEDGPARVPSKSPASAKPDREKPKGDKEFINGVEVLDLSGKKDRVPEFLEGVEIERGEPEEESPEAAKG